MISDYSYTAADNIGSSDGSSPAKSSKKIEKGLKRLLVIAVIIFAAELVWLFGISPFIPFSTIEVHGFEGLRRAEVLQLAGIDETSSFMSTNTSLVQEKLSGNILVESAKVTKRFPDKLSISLIGRKAAAVTLSNISGKQAPVYIDTHGVFFKTGNNPAEIDGLVIISGLDNPQVNMRLPDSLVSLMENIAWLSAGSPELLSAISEIRIEQKAWDGYDLVLYPVHSSIRVRVENNITEEVLRYMLLMLSVFEDDSEGPAEIDFRSGMGSYKIKEKS
uniref:Putative cell division protein FtsQ n=1 Tax=uncultured bacterium contig00015 TaxID=1181506 RepID=A0A806KPU6_9BACT|nr:putative cell division protein FtsQ [uncultured bacterium contig00015]